LIGLTDKWQIIAVFCGVLVGNFPLVQLVYKDQLHPHFTTFPVDWEITHSPKHWSKETTMANVSGIVFDACIKYLDTTVLLLF